MKAQFANRQYLDKNGVFLAIYDEPQQKTFKQLFKVYKTGEKCSITTVHKQHYHVLYNGVNYPASGTYYLFIFDELIYIGKASCTVSLDKFGRVTSKRGLIDRINDFGQKIISYFQDELEYDALDPYQKKFVDKYTVDDLQYVSAKIVAYGAGMSKELRRLVDSEEAKAQYYYLKEHGKLPHCNTKQEDFCEIDSYLNDTIHLRCEDITPARLF